jgi:hypothetical protein
MRWTPGIWLAILGRVADAHGCGYIARMAPTAKAYFKRRLNTLEGQIAALRREIGASREVASADADALRTFVEDGTAFVDMLFSAAQGEDGPAWRVGDCLWIHAGRAADALGAPWSSASVREAIAPVSGARRCYRGAAGRTVHGIEIDMSALREALQLAGETDVADEIDRCLAQA